MVKILSKHEGVLVEEAVTQAEQQTSAEIVMFVAHSSDNYLDFILLYSMLLADFVMLGLYAGHIVTSFPAFLLIQLGIMLLCCIPALRHCCCCLIPDNVTRRRSYRNALEEFHIIHRQLPAGAPLVVMFISIAERYAHIVSNHMVDEKINKKQWDDVIDGFKKVMHTEGLAQACMGAAGQLGGMLAVHFPKNAAQQGFSNQVIEKP